MCQFTTDFKSCLVILPIGHQGTLEACILVRSGSLLKCVTIMTGPIPVQARQLFQDESVIELKLNY